MYTLRCMWRLRRAWASHYGASHLVYHPHITTSSYFDSAISFYIALGVQSPNIYLQLRFLSRPSSSISTHRFAFIHCEISCGICSPLPQLGCSFRASQWRAGWRSSFSFRLAAHILYSYIVFSDWSDNILILFLSGDPYYRSSQIPQLSGSESRRNSCERARPGRRATRPGCVLRVGSPAYSLSRDFNYKAARKAVFYFDECFSKTDFFIYY